MPQIEKRSFDSPDDVRPAGSGEGRTVKIGGVTFARVTLPPGWRWSKDVKPITQTDACQAHHVGYMVSGRLHVVLSDGSEEEFGPGDLSDIPPGHDAWVVGDDPVVSVDVTGSDVWAKPA
jgi:hypothetical protein